VNMCQFGFARCRPLRAGAPPLRQAQTDADLARLSGSTHGVGAMGTILSSGNCAATTAFANRIVEIAQSGGHHPGMPVGCDRCRTAYGAYSAGGISENDAICAVETEALCRI
jgi:pterin-4a-carbinolamine dehydratase